MNTLGQLGLGAAQVIQSDTKEVIGYAYTVASGKGQLQRWLLYKNPGNSFDVRPPPPNMSGMSLSDWQAYVPSLWVPGSFYVRAQADVYCHGDGSNGTWTKIPPANKLPAPSYPDVPGAPFQLDYTRYRVLDVIQEQFRGFAYSVGSVTDDTSAEYWMLPAAYEPAGGSAVVEVATGVDMASSLQEFIDVANQSFGPGCSFAITGCVNYTGMAAPAMP